MEIIIANRFKLIKKIGGGAFGIIYEGIDLITQDSVSVKLVSYYSSVYIKTYI